MTTAPPMAITPTPLTTNVELTAPAQQPASLGSEQKLIDYIAHLQSQGVTTQSFNNPAGLASEAMKSLKGYLERANSLSDQVARRMKGMDQSESEAAFGGNVEELPGGPASQSLTESQASDNGGADGMSKVTMSELQRLSEVLTESLRYGAETTVVSTAAGNISKSVTTLMHG
jgi:hypothetical protein